MGRVQSSSKIVYTIKMKIIWDEPKRVANIKTHGLDLAGSELFDWDGATVVPGHSDEGGRPRFRAIGWMGDELVTLVFSRLGAEAISVIQPASGEPGRK